MAEARKAVPELSPAEVKQRLDRGEKHVLLDVREKEEYRDGHLEGALSLPRGFLEMRVEESVPDTRRRSSPTAPGALDRCSRAASCGKWATTNVISMSGGFTGWKNAGSTLRDRPPVHARSRRHATAATSCFPRSARRGRRSFSTRRCSASAPAGSARRRRSTWPLPASARSASSTRTWSTSRTCSARSCTPTTASACPRSSPREVTLQALNPDVKVVEFSERLSSENVRRIFERLRHHRERLRQLPDALSRQRRLRILKKPLVDGAIFQFEGQATCLLSGEGPLLPLPLPGAAASGRGAVVRRSGRARRAARV